MSSPRRHVLFVCLGNICRSPAAEAVALHLADHSSLDLGIDSAGTSGYHDGEIADPRMREAGERRGYHFPSRSRRVRPADYLDFDWIVAMDRTNLSDLEKLKPTTSRARLSLFSEFSGEAFPTDVPDPYYGGKRGFEEVIDMLEAGMPRLLLELNQGE